MAAEPKQKLRLRDAFRANKRGSVALPAAVFVTALLGATGGALDFWRSTDARADLQRATDAATIATARAELATLEEQRLFATRFMKASLSETFDGTLGTVTVETFPGEGIRLAATAEVETSLLAVAGYDTITVNSAAAAVPGLTASAFTDIALVLDTSSSMEGSRLTSLKSAATDMIERVEDVGETQISVVPFNTYVNVGLGNRGAAGLDIPADIIDVTQSCSERAITEDVNCTSVETTCSECNWVSTEVACLKDGEPSTCTSTRCDSYEVSCTQNQCEQRTIGLEQVCNTIDNSVVWNGCVGSLEYPQNTIADIGGAGAPGILGLQCGGALTRMSDNYTTLKSAVAGLTTRGDTYAPAGLVWGWRTLSPGLPFPDTATGNDRKRILVLMSDGNNSRSKTVGNARHNGTDVAAADALTLEICDNIKAQEIELHTVAFQVSSPTARAVLENCATNATDYHHVALTEEDLREAFMEVIDSRKSWRLAQ